MIRRLPLLAVAAALVGAAATMGAVAPSAAAKPAHVGIVVRLSNSATVTKCVAVGGSGLDVLVRGFPSTQIGQSGPYAGFVLSIKGVGQNPPDDTHYWSYWHRTSSGWKYSGSGAGGSTPKAGGVEGWSYVDGQQHAPQPKSLSYAKICAGRDPAPKPTKPASSTPAPPTHSQSSSVAPSTAAQSVSPTRATSSTPTRMTHPKRSHAQHPRRSRTPNPPATAAFAPQTHAAGGKTRAVAGQSPSNTQAAIAAERAAATPTASPVAQSSHTSAFPAAGTVIALVVLAALGGFAWFRLRSRTE